MKERLKSEIDVGATSALIPLIERGLKSKNFIRNFLKNDPIRGNFMRVFRIKLPLIGSVLRRF
jgi:hypothetical protein